MYITSSYYVISNHVTALYTYAMFINFRHFLYVCIHPCMYITNIVIYIYIQTRVYSIHFMPDVIACMDTFQGPRVP